MAVRGALASFVVDSLVIRHTLPSTTAYRPPLLSLSLFPLRDCPTLMPRFPRFECQCASHLEETFLIDFPVNQSSGFILQNFHCLSNDCETVIQRQLCLDSTNLLRPVEQKCHNHLRALEVINHPPDKAVYHKFTLEMVCHMLFLSS